MSTDAEKKLLSSILNQLNGEIDWDKVVKDVNVPTKSVAQMRWTRFKKTLPNLESNGNGTDSPPATPKKRQSPTKSKTPKGSSKKKQKRSKSGIDSDDEDEEAQFENDDEEENKKVTTETPARSLPSRKAKTRSPIKDVRTTAGFHILIDY